MRPGNAREIIVLQPDSQSALEADTRLAATLAALEGLPQGMAEQNVVVQSSHADSAPFFSAGARTRCIAVNAASPVAHVPMPCLLHSGGHVWW